MELMMVVGDLKSIGALGIKFANGIIKNRNLLQMMLLFCKFTEFYI